MLDYIVEDHNYSHSIKYLQDHLNLFEGSTKANN